MGFLDCSGIYFFLISVDNSSSAISMAVLSSCTCTFSFSSASRYEGDLDGTYQYVYDGIGNLIRDRESGVEEIRWTVYGKIASIRKTDGTLISYRYDPSGNRIYKDVLKDAQTQRTWYVRDAQGNPLAVYGQSPAEPAPSLQEQHLYGSSRLGIWSVDAAGSESYLSKWNGKDGKTLYELTNHLGNVVGTVSGGTMAVAKLPW